MLTLRLSVDSGRATHVAEALAAGGAAIVLAVNVTLLMLSGSLTLLAQRWVSDRR